MNGKFKNIFETIKNFSGFQIKLKSCIQMWYLFHNILLESNKNIAMTTQYLDIILAIL